MSMLGLNIGTQQVQKQSLVITPQLQHAISILQMNNLELEKHLEDLAESNPFIEVKGVNSENKRKAEIDFQPAKAGAGISNSFMETLLGERPETLLEHICKQIRLQNFSEQYNSIAYRLLADITPAGYLPIDLEEVADQLSADLADVTAVLEQMQGFEPVGLFARNLAECLTLQAKERKEFDAPMKVVLANLEMLAQGKIKELCNLAGCSAEDVKQRVLQIRQYNPKPGALFDCEALGSNREPDLIVQRHGDQIEIALNRSSLPSVKVNMDYANTLNRSTQSEEKSVEFIKNSIATGHWLKRAIAQRNQTLQMVAQHILKHQIKFFDEGIAGIRPLQLRIVAEALGIHESTVSRSTASVLIQTPRGTFPLKMFFSSGLQANTSEEGVSARAIRNKITAIIAEESPLKPISDAKISSILAEEGFTVARRTVAKYRELENIKSTAQRKREYKLNTLIAK